MFKNLQLKFKFYFKFRFFMFRLNRSAVINKLNKMLSTISAAVIETSTLGLWKSSTSLDYSEVNLNDFNEFSSNIESTIIVKASNKSLQCSNEHLTMSKSSNVVAALSKIKLNTIVNNTMSPYDRSKKYHALETELYQALLNFSTKNNRELIRSVCHFNAILREIQSLRIRLKRDLNNCFTGFGEREQLNLILEQLNRIDAKLQVFSTGMIGVLPNPEWVENEHIKNIYNLKLDLIKEECKNRFDLNLKFCTYLTKLQENQQSQ